MGTASHFALFSTLFPKSREVLPYAKPSNHPCDSRGGDLRTKVDDLNSQILGDDIQLEQVALQRWEDGQIVEETFYHA